MKTLQEIKAKLTEIKPILQAKYPLKSIAIFGSYARNEQTENSDVDIVVDIDSAIGFGFFRLADEIEGHLGIKTDVATTKAIKPRYFELIKEDLIYV